MIKLYNDSVTSYTNLGLGVLTDFTQAPVIIEELNGVYTLEFSYSNKGSHAEELKEGRVVVIDNQPFRIWNVKRNIFDSNYFCKYLFFDLENVLLEDVAPTNLATQGAIAWIFNKANITLWNVTGDCDLFASSRYVRKSIIEAIYTADNAVLTRYGGEIEFNGFNITTQKKRGTDANFTIEYGRNLAGVEVNIDFSTVVTRIMPQGKNELLLTEKYVDSPKIDNYFMPFTRKIDFDIDEEDYNTPEEAQTALRNSATALFTDGIDAPTLSIKIDFIELSKTEEYTAYSGLETCKLGDYVKVKIPALNINGKVRIIKTEYNAILGRYTKLELGSVTPSITTSVAEIEKQVEEINPNSILEQAKKDANDLISHPFKAFLYIDEETGEIYLMDTNDKNTAQKIWRWNINGFAYSNTGINGTYNLAITQNGEIVADFITAGTINGGLIQAGSIIASALEINVKNAYDTFSTYIRAVSEGLEIGKSDANTKTLYTNDGMQIYNKDEKIAEATSDTFRAKSFTTTSWTIREDNGTLCFFRGEFNNG